MPHNINKTTKGFVALNPLVNVYHVGEVSATQDMITGQALLIVCDTLGEALGMAFTSYDKESGEGTPRQIDWIVVDNEAEAKGLESVINSFPKVEISIIPHNENWLVPYADFFLDMLEDSAEKTALESSLAGYMSSIKTSDELND